METPNQKITRKTQVQMGDNIKQNIFQMKIKIRIACVQDRRKWKDVVEKAKTFNH